MVSRILENLLVFFGFPFLELGQHTLTHRLANEFPLVHGFVGVARPSYKRFLLAFGLKRIPFDHAAKSLLNQCVGLWLLLKIECISIDAHCFLMVLALIERFGHWTSWKSHRNSIDVHWFRIVSALTERLGHWTKIHWMSRICHWFRMVSELIEGSGFWTSKTNKHLIPIEFHGFRMCSAFIERNRYYTSEEIPLTSKHFIGFDWLQRWLKALGIEHPRQITKFQKTFLYWFRRILALIERTRHWTS